MWLKCFCSEASYRLREMHSLVPMHSKASNEARKWIAGLVDPQVFFLLFIFLFALQVTKSRGLGSGNETTYVVNSYIPSAVPT